VDPRYPSGDAGAGGKGGNGGDGGGGGGGCGGASFGIYVAGHKGADLTYIKETNTIHTNGQVGAKGGAGGYSLSQPGTGGADGAYAATNF
jgi:hypothetical protein